MLWGVASEGAWLWRVSLAGVALARGGGGAGLTSMPHSMLALPQLKSPYGLASTARSSAASSCNPFASLASDIRERSSRLLRWPARLRTGVTRAWSLRHDEQNGVHAVCFSLCAQTQLCSLSSYLSLLVYCTIQSLSTAYSITSSNSSGEMAPAAVAAATATAVFACELGSEPNTRLINELLDPVTTLADNIVPTLVVHYNQRGVNNQAMPLDCAFFGRFSFLLHTHHTCWCIMCTGTCPNSNPLSLCSTCTCTTNLQLNHRRPSQSCSSYVVFKMSWRVGSCTECRKEVCTSGVGACTSTGMR